LNPDLNTSQTLVSDGRLGVFSSTGHLAAWEREGGVELRDLRDQESHVEEDVTEFGFVPSADRQRGARLWACKDGTLGRIDIDLGFVALDSEARCQPGSIQAASDGPFVAYRAAEDQLRVVDIDSEQVVSLDVEHRVDGNQDDEFELSASGELVISRAYRIEHPDPSDTQQRIHEGSVALATTTGTQLQQSDKTLGFLEGPSGATVVRGGGQAWVVDASLDFSELAPGIEPRKWISATELLVHDGNGLGRLDTATQSVTLWLPGAQEGTNNYGLGSDGTSLVSRVDTPGCYPQSGECNFTVSELQTVAIDGAPQTLASFTHGLDQVAISASGSVFAEIGLLPSLPDEELIHGAFVFSPEGEILAEWTGEAGDVRVRKFHNLEDRFLTMIEHVAGTSIESIDPETGVVTTLVPDVSFDVEIEVQAGLAMVLDDSSGDVGRRAAPRVS